MSAPELEFIRTFWPVIYTIAGAALAFIVWFLRLEAEVKHLKKTQETEGLRIARAIEHMSSTQSQMTERLQEVRETLIRIESYYEGAQSATKNSNRRKV